jgi:hypothetical protein
MSNFLLELASSMVKQAAKLEAENLLQHLKDTDPQEYEACVRAGHAFVKPLAKLALKTKTKIDDNAVGAFDEAINESAAVNSIAL